MFIIDEESLMLLIVVDLIQQRKAAREAMYDQRKSESGESVSGDQGILPGHNEEERL